MNVADQEFRRDFMPHRIRVPQWAVRRGQRINHFTELNVQKTALVVVDLQNAFLAGTKPFVEEFGLPIVPRVNKLATSLREAGGVVTWLRQTFDDAREPALAAWKKDAGPNIVAFRNSLRSGGQAQALFSELDVRGEDLILDKYRHSAFSYQSSDLHERLQERGVDTIIVTGAMTNVCCESTARDANGRGYRVFFINDATATLSNAEHNAALLNMTLAFADVRNTKSMLALIKAGRAS